MWSDWHSSVFTARCLTRMGHVWPTLVGTGAFTCTSVSAEKTRVSIFGGGAQEVGTVFGASASNNRIASPRHSA